MNYNKIINKLKKNSKGLSPVVASIILIAVTVAVSVVVAAWMGGMSLGLMGNAEQATITNLQLVDAATTITATVQNSGDADISIMSAAVNGQSCTVTGSPVAIAKGESVNVVITGVTALDSGTSYTVKLATAKGNNLVYTQTCP